MDGIQEKWIENMDRPKLFSDQTFDRFTKDHRKEIENEIDSLDYVFYKNNKVRSIKDEFFNKFRVDSVIIDFNNIMRVGHNEEEENLDIIFSLDIKGNIDLLKNTPNEGVDIGEFHRPMGSICYKCKKIILIKKIDYLEPNIYMDELKEEMNEIKKWHNWICDDVEEYNVFLLEFINEKIKMRKKYVNKMKKYVDEIDKN